MCTAATYKSADFYMGRTLDYEFSYGEEITVMPRRYPLAFRHGGKTESHYAIIGMAHVADDYPLYYDAVNEKGLGMAGLNFVGNAVYAEPEEGKQNVAQYEFIPWLLSQCATLDEARSRLSKMNLTGTPFSGQLPSAQLHWIIADATGAIVVESMADGLHIYENPTGVLTNNPPFLQQLFALNNYMHLSAKQPENAFSEAIPLMTYSRGMGALGLPGDLSSMSRFARVAFTRAHSSPDRQRRRVWDSFSIFWARSISSVAAVRSRMENMRSRSIRPAGMRQKVFTTIRRTRIIRSRQWICTGRIWTVRYLLAIRCWRKRSSGGRTDSR